MNSVILVQEEPRNASELLEVPVTTNGLFRVNFPDNQQLRSLTTQSIIIQGIRLINALVLSNGPITGYATAPATEVVKAVMVLYCEGWEKGHYIPLNVLSDVNIPTSAVPHRYQSTKFANWRNVDWSKSYILYANGTSGSAGQPYSFLFDIEYVKLDASGTEIIGPS